MPSGLVLLLLAAAAAAGTSAAAAGAATTPACPAGTTLVDTFKDSSGASWSACEDLQQPGGTIALVPENEGAVEWFEKGYERYADPSAVEARYYFPALGLNKAAVMHDPADVLGQTICPGPARAFKRRSVSLYKSVLYDAFTWARRALNS
jgi:hypothetical protein